MVRRCVKERPHLLETKGHGKLMSNDATTPIPDPELVEEARRVAGAASEAEVITEALREYIERRKQRAIIDLFGTVAFDDTYDYKAERWRQTT